MSFETVARQSLYRQTHAHAAATCGRWPTASCWAGSGASPHGITAGWACSSRSAWSVRCSGSPRRCWRARSSTRSARGALGVVVMLAGGDRGGRRRRGRRVAGDALAVVDHRRGPDPRPAHRRVRPRAADARRVLHPHPHRRTGQQARQRRDGRAARLLRHVLRRHHQHRHPDADAGGHAQDLVAGHAAVAGADAAVPAARPSDRANHGAAVARGRHPQRDDEHPDDRTLFGARARRWSSCSAARRPNRASSRCGPAGSATSGCAPRCCSRSS